MADAIKGRGTIEELAKRFPQLYVAPAEDALDAYKLAAGRGLVFGDANLGHFRTSEEDELRMVETPAGPVAVVFLKNRCDFETFLQIVGHKAQPVPIAPTVGAITYRGLADWGEVAAARLEYEAAGGEDWSSEFARRAKQPGAFRTEIVVISEGPYSNVSADDTPYDEREWERISREIRLHHECAHVVCRRTMPEDVLPVWDEITADVVGLACATGQYDCMLAARFFGATEEGFAGGRLIEYLDDGQKADIDAIAVEVFGAIAHIGKSATPSDLGEPFTWLLELKKNPLISY